MKKKISLYSTKLDIGGIERAMINYVNLMDKNKYDITLFLEKSGGAFQNEIAKDIKIVNFNQSNHKNPLIRKALNFYKLFLFRIKYRNKFDFAANFGSVVKSGAILSKVFSSNNAYWIHGHLWKTKEEAEDFIQKYEIDKYQKIVFVSNRVKESYQKFFPDSNQKLYVMNNPIDEVDIIKKSKEKIDIKKRKLTFLNVGRHSEEEKHLTMMLKVLGRLINEGYDFDLWLLGSGPDTKMYQDLVEELKIENYVKFLGFSKNVYPYYKECDAILLSSYNEGNPVVFLESKILNKPIITTDVSDAKQDLLGFGIVTDNNEEAYYNGVKEYLDHGYKIKKPFNPKKYNEDILKKLDQVIEEVI